MSVLKTIILTSALITGGLTISAYAADMSDTHQVAASQSISQMGNFAKKSFGVKGQWSVLTVDGQRVLRLSDDFKTKKGPDLKIFLSPTSASTVNGANATQGSIKLGRLKSHKGGSDYVIPAGVNLTNFNSVLIHCEAFSKLWAAGTL